MHKISTADNSSSANISYFVTTIKKRKRWTSMDYLPNFGALMMALCYHFRHLKEDISAERELSVFNVVRLLVLYFPTLQSFAPCGPSLGASDLSQKMRCAMLFHRLIATERYTFTAITIRTLCRSSINRTTRSEMIRQS